MSLPDQDREMQALDWVRRIADPAFGAWQEHLLWLEADPLNAEAFDRVSLGMEDASEGLAPPGAMPPRTPIANDNDGTARHRRWTIATSLSGVAAAGVAALLFWSHPAGPADRLIQTMPGVSRELALGDGTRIALNGGSRLRIESDREITLLNGEAFFEVAHHAENPFRLHAGGRVIQDVGTAFDVALSPEQTRVSVRDGAIAIDPDGANVALVAGQEARIGAGGEILRTTVMQDHAIGGWRDGRLVYQGASWTEVVSDLNRAMGVEVTLAPGMATQRFTGVVSVDRDHARTVRRLADAAGLSATPEGDGWRLAPR